ncbi:MAG: DUF4286 family protein [Planctomycetota bacterium]
MIAYTVRCRFDDPMVGAEWIAWLVREHLADVIAGGAIDATVVQLDGDPLTCEVRYHFPTRAAFDRYERDHAPALREEGLKQFPLERGLHYERSVGEVMANYPDA